MRKRGALPGVQSTDLLDLACLTSAEAELAKEISIETRRRLSPAAIRACHGIGKAWALESDEVAELLAMTSADFDTTLARSDETVLDHAQFERAGLIIAIFGALRRLFERRRADKWPRKPNSGVPFNGRSAIEFMRGGDVANLEHVLRHLQAAFHGL